MMGEWNNRYANYARSQGRSAQEQQDHERKGHAPALGFLLWHSERLSEASREIPEAFAPAVTGPRGALIDHEGYDAWLTAWVDRHVAEKVAA